MPTLTVTARGQITLGREFLRHMNVSPGDKIRVEKLPGGRIMVRAASPTIANFSGCLKQSDGPKFTIDDIKRITEECWADMHDEPQIPEISSEAVRLGK